MQQLPLKTSKSKGGIQPLKRPPDYSADIWLRILRRMISCGVIWTNKIFCTFVSSYPCQL